MAAAAAWVWRPGSLLRPSLRPLHLSRRRSPFMQPLRSASSASRIMSDAQPDSNTWCKPADLDMASWAAPIVRDILELYHCRADDPRVYERYAPDAIFDDPAGTLHGRAAIRVAMEALPKVFSHGEPKNVDIKYYPPLIGGERNRFQGSGGIGSSAGREQIGPQARVTLVQTYEWRRDLLPFGLSPGVFLGQQNDSNVALPTVVYLTFDEETRLVTRHEDRWWGKDTQSTSPFVGPVHGFVKHLNGRVWEAWGARRYGS